MITKELAQSLRHGTVLWHRSSTNSDGTPARCRVNGQCKTWVKEPNRFRLPVKYGMRKCFYLTELNAVEWSLPDRWPVERHWQ